MSQQDQLVSRAVEMQQNTFENSQQALQQAVELPLEQTVQFQKNATELFLNGLEMSNWAQDRGLELTRDAFSTYIDTMENAVENASQTAQAAQPQAQRGTWGQMQPGTTPPGQSRQTGANQPPAQATGQQPTTGYQQQFSQGTDGQFGAPTGQASYQAGSEGFSAQATSQPQQRQPRQQQFQQPQPQRRQPQQRRAPPAQGSQQAPAQQPYQGQAPAQPQTQTGYSQPAPQVQEQEAVGTPTTDSQQPTSGQASREEAQPVETENQ